MPECWKDVGAADEQPECEYKVLLRRIKHRFSRGADESDPTFVSDDTFLEWLTVTLINLLQLISPTTVFRALFNRRLCGIKADRVRHNAVDLWCIIKVVAAGLLLLTGRTTGWGAAIIPIIFLVDLYVHLVLVVLEPSIYLLRRNIILLGFNFVEVIFDFALLFLANHALALGLDGPPVTDAATAIYFSLVTFATVGYGDVLALTGHGRLLVALEIVAGLLFMAIVVTTFISKSPLSRAKTPDAKR